MLQAVHKDFYEHSTRALTHSILYTPSSCRSETQRSVSHSKRAPVISSVTFGCWARARWRWGLLLLPPLLLLAAGLLRHKLERGRQGEGGEGQRDRGT